MKIKLEMFKQQNNYYTCIYLLKHIYTHTPIHTNMHAYTDTKTHIHTLIHTRTSTYIYILCEVYKHKLTRTLFYTQTA